MPNLNIDLEVMQWLHNMNLQNANIAANHGAAQANAQVIQPPPHPAAQEGIFANAQFGHPVGGGFQPPADVWIMDEVVPEEEMPMPQLDVAVKKVKATPRKPEDNVGKKMQELYPYPALKLGKVAATAYEKGRTPKGEPFQWTTQQGYIGIEIEVENITRDIPIEAYWACKPDGSLRNHGVEMVSNPLAVKQIQLAVEHAYSALYQNNQPDFSNRTSVHIHVNCRDMTQDQVYNMVLLYAIFEKHFFAVAGTKRLNSIFCVPMYRCNILKNAWDLIYHMTPNWKKYCAINLLPLVPNNDTGCYGTIEFRHLYGTSDPQELMKWINDILCLRQWAMTFETKWLIEQIKTMNSTSQYLGLYNQVFEKGRKILTNRLDFEECISDIKRELFGGDYWNTLNRSADGVYWKLVHSLGIRG